MDLKGLVVVIAILGCGPKQIGVDEAGDELGESGSTGSTGTTGTTDSADSATSTDASTDDTSTDTSTGSSEGVFIPYVDAYTDNCMCDPFAQDCPEGEKCAPTIVAASSWNCVECVPILGDHEQGEACAHDPETWTDDCDATSWCLDGLCHAFCQGTADEPECGVDSFCVMANQGTINICASACDPIAQDCEGGQACFWSGMSFGCFMPAPVDDEACEFINDCPIGQQCTAAAELPACAGEACCTSYCDVFEPGGCAATPGTTCTPFFAGEGFEQVGLCTLP